MKEEFLTFLACLFLIPIMVSGQNVGIGTSTPTSTLEVHGYDNNGVHASIAVVSGTQHLLVDGNEIDCVDGPLYLNYNSKNDLMVRTATRRAEINFTHASGSGSSNGLSIENEAANHAYWTLYSTNSDGNFELYYQGNFVGEFASGTGVYSTVSDLRLKQNIMPLGPVLSKVALLRPSVYAMKSDPAGQPNLGFIAQDVAPLFPELVRLGSVGDSGHDLYTLNYSGFAVVAIAAIQELIQGREAEKQAWKTENQALKNRIDLLESRLKALELRMGSGS